MLASLLERQLKKIWSKRGLVACLLWPLSLVFRCLIWLRRNLYRYGMLASYQANVPVLVVGNIAVGGTGKTPFVGYVATWLHSQNIQVGLLSRGYGRLSSEPILVTPNHTASEAGDEAKLLQQQTGCPMVVASDRVAGIELLLKSHPKLQLVICDDGLQHYRLQRTAEIAVIDGKTMHGNGWCLPAGFLREPPSRLNTVDLVVVKSEVRNDGNCAPTVIPRPAAVIPRLDRGIQNESNSLARLDPGFRRNDVRAVTFDNAFTLQLHKISSILTGEELAQSLWQALTVYAVAGIGHPENFFSSLRQQGMQVSAHPFPDHHQYQAADFAFAAANPEVPVLMTSKDAVKCLGFAKQNWYQVEVKVVPARALQIRLRKLLESII